MVDTILRPLNDEETKDTIDLRSQKKNEREKFRILNIKKQQEFTIKHQPYCFRCARLDCEETQELEYKRKGSKTGHAEDVLISINLDQYSKPERFKLLKKEPVIEKKLVDGIRVPYQTGMWHEYQCKERGCRISVECPNNK